MLRFLHICLILLCLAAYLSPVVDPTAFWPVATLGLLAPLLWLLVLLFALYWIYRRDNAYLLSVVTLVLGWSVIRTAIAVPQRATKTAESVAIASLNGHAFWPAKWKDKKTADTIGRFIEHLDADLLCLQELPRGRVGEGLHKALEKRGYAYAYRDGDGGLAIFSRLPIRNGGAHYFANKTNGFSWCDVDHEGQTWRIYNLHLQSNTITHKAIQQATEGDLKTKETWLTIKNMFGRYGRAARTRTEQVRHVLAELRGSPYPVIVAGDFNDVPASYAYKLLSDELQDAHLLGDWGLGATYAGALPGLRIDYVMPDKSFEVVDFEQYDCFFSDHKAVRALIQAVQ